MVQEPHVGENFWSQEELAASDVLKLVDETSG
jgi:hypothetical protein